MSGEGSASRPVNSTYWPDIRRILDTEPARMNDYNGTCDICQRQMDLRTQDELEHACTRISVCACGHMFGTSCLMNWLNTKTETYVSNCPRCRADLRFKSLKSFESLAVPAPCQFRQLGIAMREPSLGSCCPAHRLADRLATAIDRQAHASTWIDSVVRLYCVFTVEGVMERPMYVKASGVEEVFLDDPAEGEGQCLEVDLGTPFWQDIWQRVLMNYSVAERNEIRLTSIRFRGDPFLQNCEQIINEEILRRTRDHLHYETLDSEPMPAYEPQEIIYTGILPQYDFEAVFHAHVRDNVQFARAMDYFNDEIINEVLNGGGDDESDSDDNSEQDGDVAMGEENLDAIVAGYIDAEVEANHQTILAAQNEDAYEEYLERLDNSDPNMDGLYDD